MSKAFLVSMVVMTLAAFGVASYTVKQNAINIELEANKMYSAPLNRQTEDEAVMEEEMLETGQAKPANKENSESEMCVTMSYNEAIDIARAGECGENAELTETHFCNEGTKTWWIDLDLKKEGCRPACVINTENKTVEINWRCTGAMMPPGATFEIELPSKDTNPLESPDPEITPILPDAATMRIQ